MIGIRSQAPDQWVLAGFKSGGIEIQKLVKLTEEKVKDSENGDLYFVKSTNSYQLARRYEGEAESLKALGKACPELVARLICKGSYLGKTVMISERFEVGYMSSEAEAQLGRRVAKMHDWDNNEGARSPTGMYGFHVPTFCGETEQDNTWKENWLDFFRDHRLRPLIKLIGDPVILALGAQLCQTVVPFLLKDFYPPPKPVIIHGDMWSGNVYEDKESGKPVIYDPSSYYGHHEVELGIMNMFGGRSKTFFEKYHACLPKSQPHHTQRIRLYELYHYLNHTLLFGSGYRQGTISIMKELIHFVEKHSQSD